MPNPFSSAFRGLTLAIGHSAKHTSIDQVRGVEHVLTRFKFQDQALSLSATPAITIQFGEENRVFGRAPVNHYFGAYHLADNGMLHWALPGFGSTMMVGPEDLMTAESCYFAALESARVLCVEGSRVVIENLDRTTVLEFERTVFGEAERRLIGKTLVLARLIADGQPIPLPAGPFITMFLHHDGQISGFSGINGFDGVSRRDTHGGIHFRSIVATKRAGPAETAAAEYMFLIALGKVTMWTPSLDGAVLKNSTGSTILEFAVVR